MVCQQLFLHKRKPRQTPPLLLRHYYLASNRFLPLTTHAGSCPQTLQNDLFAPRYVDPFYHSNVYSLCQGSEALYITQYEPSPFVFGVCAVGNFIAHCSICTNHSHTHMLCPLRRCCDCGRYGHAETICDRKNM